MVASVRKRVIRGKILPLFQGLTFKSLEGNAALFQDHFEKESSVLADGVLKLPADVDIHSGKWVTELGHKSRISRRLFRELVPDQLDNYPKLMSTESVVV